MLCNMKRKTPWFAKARLSCPDCGLIIKADDRPKEEDHGFGVVFPAKHFDCPRCKAHYTATEFYQENNFKLQKTIEIDPGDRQDAFRND